MVVFPSFPSVINQLIVIILSILCRRIWLKPELFFFFAATHLQSRHRVAEFITSGNRKRDKRAKRSACY